jgi:hypothetical protein
MVKMSCDVCQLHPDYGKRLEQCESDIRMLHVRGNETVTNQARVDVKLDYLTKMVEELKDKIDKIAERPVQRWDALVNAAIAGILSILLSGGITLVLIKTH